MQTLDLKQFMNRMMSLDEYDGRKIIRREIAYGARPDVFLFYTNRDYYSCFEEFDKYQEAYKKFEKF